jgi:hypothetical protein
VTIHLVFTPFQKPPSVEIEVWDNENTLAAAVHIIETNETDNEITLHLPEDRRPGLYRVHARAYYLNLKHPEDPSTTYQPPESAPIGDKETTFSIQ